MNHKTHTEDTNAYVSARILHKRVDQTVETRVSELNLKKNWDVTRALTTDEQR